MSLWRTASKLRPERKPGDSATPPSAQHHQRTNTSRTLSLLHQHSCIYNHPSEQQGKKLHLHSQHRPVEASALITKIKKNIHKKNTLLMIVTPRVCSKVPASNQSLQASDERTASRAPLQETSISEGVSIDGNRLCGHSPPSGQVTSHEHTPS